VKAGRPRGSSSFERDLVDAPVSRCARCGSTERLDYRNVETIHGEGRDPQGRPYTAVELRPTKCISCGQSRIDRTWIYCPVK